MHLLPTHIPKGQSAENWLRRQLLQVQLPAELPYKSGGALPSGGGEIPAENAPDLRRDLPGRQGTVKLQRFKQAPLPGADKAGIPAEDHPAPGRLEGVDKAVLRHPLLPGAGQLPVEKVPGVGGPQLGEEGQAQLPGTCSLIFSGCSQNVPLMARAANTSTDEEFAQYYGTRMATTTKNNVKGGQLVEFYVNETPDGDPFTVNLNTAGTTGLTTYTSTTVNTTALPRNSIFPLTLNFPDYVPDFNWQAWLAPVGDWCEVEVDYDTNTYTVKVPEGAKFDFSLNGVTSSTGGTVAATAVWNVPKSTERWFTNYTKADGAVSGYISATGVGTQLPLSVTVSWQQGDNTLNRKYNVIIELIDITDADFKTRAGGEQSRLLAPEVLNMFIKR